jgi:SH3-like domain-containing protein
MELSTVTLDRPGLSVRIMRRPGISSHTHMLNAVTGLALNAALALALGLALAAAPVTVAPPTPLAVRVAHAAPGTDGTGLPLPRFVSLRAEQVNLRTGPGVRYPIDWVYLRRALPVEIVQEFQTWRKIRDPEGSEGWVHQSMLSGRRTVLTLAGTHSLHTEPRDDAPIVAYVEGGVQAGLIQCPRATDFCRVEVNGTDGWLRRSTFWGVYRNEYID